MSKTAKLNARRYILAATVSLAVAGLYGCSDDSGSSSQMTPCGGLCTESQTCISGSCIDNSRICDDAAICPSSQTCRDNKCVDNDKICGDAVCTDSQTCKNDKCIDNDKICGDAICTDSQTCKNDKCIDNDKICDDVICSESQTCKYHTCVDNEKICGNDVCTDTQTCKNGSCIDNSKICGDDICTIDETCREGSCVDTQKICGDNLCKDNETCLNEICVPTDSICGNLVSCDLETEECVDNTHCEPIDPCRNVVCQIEGQICDNGTCRDRKPCENIHCNDGQECAITTLNPLGECIDTKCAIQNEGDEYKTEKVCDENQMCVDGNCIDDGCLDKKCDEGWICIKGNCEEEACIGITCGDGRTCVAGDCYDDECLPKDEHVCEEGKTCSKGDCIFDKCVGVVCPQDKVCIEAGTCQFTSDPAIVLGRMEDMTTDETGKTTSAQISLNHMPASAVTFTCEIIPPESADEATVDCSDIALTPENWFEMQSITLIGVADNTVDGDQQYKVKITSHSEDPEFDGLTMETETLTNVDVDKASINAVDADGLMTSESGTSAEFKLSLGSKPANPVTITLTSSDTAEGIITSVGGVAGNTITIQPEDWDKPITVVVTGVDDTKHDPDSTFNVTFDVKSDDTNYNGLVIPAVTIKNGDNDTPSANFSKTELVTDETPSSASFAFHLATAPKADVKATLSITKNSDEITLSQTEATIAKADWQKDVSITVTGVADHIIDPDEHFEITVTFTSEDADYNFVKTVTGTNKNTDTAEFVLPAIGSSTVTEAGSSVNLEVRLSSKPTGKVVVTAKTNDATETKITSAPITIAPEDWDSPHMVTVAGVDDNIVDGPQVSIISLEVTSSEDTNFKSLKLDAWKITTEDDDKAGLVVSKSSISVNENAGKDTFTVALAAQPESKSVSVAVSSTNTSALTVSPATLTFTSANWNKPQTVTATGVNNNIADLNGQRSSIINLVSSSEDAIHAGLKGSVSATILDDDTPSIDLNIVNANLSQATKSTTVSVSLSMEPASAVTVTLAPNSTVFGLSTTSLSFNSSNWNKPQTVTVTANAGNAVNAWTYGTITGTASSTNAYNGKKDTVNVTYKSMESITGNTTATNVTSCSSSATLLPGRYKLQVWGASGGDGYNNDQSKGSHGGLGGYAEGILNLTAKTTVYLHYGTIGTRGYYGSTGTNAKGAGCNGGGGGTEHSSYTYGFGGGGASDIRLGGDTYYHRVLVAGGGGGADNATGEPNGGGDDGSGGYGGGTSGGYGRNAGQNSVAPGTQTTGYKFGEGQSPVHEYDLGGGGGGWYGGYAPATTGDIGGGGGSGFVYTSSSAGNVPSGYLLPSTMQLTNTVLRGGNESFPAVTSGNETGHKGNGYVKITLLE